MAPEPRPWLDDFLHQITYGILYGMTEKNNMEVITMYVTKYLVPLVISRDSDWETWRMNYKGLAEVVII